MDRKHLARKLCDELITAWLMHRTNDEAIEIVERYFKMADLEGRLHPCYFCNRPVDTKTAKVWVNDAEPCCDECEP